MTVLELRVLGPFEATSGGQAVAIPSRKSRALMAILATAPGFCVTRAKAMSLLWGDRGEAQARASLRQELASLRRALGPGAAAALGADAERVWLVSEAVAVDAAALADGAETALAAYRGPFLEDVEIREAGFESWLTEMRAGFDRQVVEAGRRCADAARAAGDWPALEASARRALDLEPYDGAAIRALMEALEEQGRRPAGLEAYAAHEQLLKTDLGIAPEAETAALRDRIAAGREPAAAPPAPDLEVAQAEAGLFRRPAVLLLPFEALGASEEDTLLAAGICEDIRTSLACWRWFPVIGPEAVAAGNGRDVQSLAASVEASYVVSGAVRRAGSRARVTAHLIDGRDGRQLWSQNFDGEMSDIFAFQDEVSRRVVSQVEPEIRRAAEARIATARPSDLSVWELLLRAADAERRGGDGYGTSAANEEQKLYLREAVARDPGSAEAWARLSRCHWRDYLMGWAAAREAALTECVEASAKAIALNPQNWLARGVHAVALLFGRHDVDGAGEHALQAVRLNPSSPLAHHSLGCVLEFAGEPEAALPHLETIFRLNPNYENASAIYCDMMMCLAIDGQIDRACELARKVVSIAPNYLRGLQRCASVLAHAGQMGEAKALLDRISELDADFSESYVRSTYPFKRAEDLEFLIDGLRKAGWRG